ncbi:hypothetical protein [Meiothermus cerbereus]|uniref:hypothetical protein n=1 Tax=Meiothermus cerbereus TaxID=65552 RepID=UPI003EED5FA9
MEKPLIVWKLPDLLKSEGVTVYNLNKTIGGRVPRETLYRWSRRMPERIDAGVLAWVLWGLQQITGRRFEVGDLLEYQD